MSQVVEHSTQFVAAADAQAIGTYLKSLSPAEGRAEFAASDATFHAVMAGQETSEGGRMYMDGCAACHRVTGNGERRAFPRLAGNAAMLAQELMFALGERCWTPNSSIARFVWCRVT